jgi:hypothetical protein
MPDLLLPGQNDDFLALKLTAKGKNGNNRGIESFMTDSVAGYIGIHSRIFRNDLRS